MPELRYPLFDGERLWDGAAVSVENGSITAVRPCAPETCGAGLLLPALIDAHVHMKEPAHVAAMLRSGIGTVCDVSATSGELAAASPYLTIVRSTKMAMGAVPDPRGYVEKAAARGAQYIKVLLLSRFSIGLPALRGIVRAAHERGLRVAVHATEVATVRQAVEAGADILLHVPMREAFPAALAGEIAGAGIAVAPTLVMMEAFARSGRGGDYRNAENAVGLLHRCGVTLLAGTDANVGGYAPAVGYGETLHRELALLMRAGLTPLEALRAATSAPASAFGLRAGRVAVDHPASLLLIEEPPAHPLKPPLKLRKLWIRGEELK